MTMWACVTAALCLCVSTSAGPRYSSRIVDTQAGPVRGIIQTSNFRHLEPVEIFYGIPYAAPPVGALRFVDATNPVGWTGTRLADTLPPVCPQLLPDLASVSVPRSRLLHLQTLLPHLRNHSEDCLHLNIYVPGSGSRGMYAPYAVVVYVHGEGFEWNSGNVYDGRILTSFGHVIFITVNYRLGVLGFLKTEEERCCFALSDIEAALRWVSGNIGAFGGDASRVTLVGQDSGAALVSLLLLRPSARGLFHRVTLVSGSMLSPWAVLGHSHLLHQQVLEKVGCLQPDNTLHCLQALPLKALLEVNLEGNKFQPRFGPWTILSPSAELERAGDTFIDRQMLLGLTSLESYLDFNASHIENGMDLEEKDTFLRMFVQNVYTNHVKEIFSAVRNEYTAWNESQDSLLRLRDSVLQAISDGHTAAPMVRMAYLHSRRGASTYLFHLAHQTDKNLLSLGLGSVRGDILAYLLGNPLTLPQVEEQDLAVAHTVLRFFTNFAKTGDPNSAGAEPDYENDKASSNIWDMYEPVNQLYLVIGGETAAQSHYRGHKMALWLNLVNQLQAGTQSSLTEFEADEDNLYAGVVRPKNAVLPSPATVGEGQGSRAVAASQECAGNTSTVPIRSPGLVDLRLAAPWALTLGLGCLLLLGNLLLLAGVYHQHLRGRSCHLSIPLPLGLARQPLMAKSQSAPELTTASFLPETVPTASPCVLKRSQNKFSV